MSYFPQNQPDFNYLRHLVLPIWDWNKPMSKKDMSMYLAHFDRRTNKADDWFYDAIMPYILESPNGNYLAADSNRGTSRNGEGDFYAIVNPNPANMRDWLLGIEAHLAPNGPIDTIDKLVPELTRQVGRKPNHPISIVIGCPYPMPNQSLFGKLKSNKPSLNFSVTAQNLMQASEQRLEAVNWFVDEALKQWSKTDFKNVKLLGFYWMYESLHYSWDIDDHWVIKEFYKHCKKRKTKLFWIPFYSSYNVRILNDYQGFYFDCAMLQPNHIFYYDVPDVKQAALEAKSRGAGFEMEYYYYFPPKFSVGNQKYNRFRNYLNGGVKYGYMKDSVCGHFIGPCDIPKMYSSPKPQEIEAYEDLFHFVKGDYELK